MKFFATKTDRGYTHFYGSRVQLVLCGDNNPVEVDVTEAEVDTGMASVGKTGEAGTVETGEVETGKVRTEPTRYYAWRTEDGKFHHVYQAEFLVRMCSPDGFKSAVDRGEGRICSVRVVELTK